MTGAAPAPAAVETSARSTAGPRAAIPRVGVSVAWSTTTGRWSARCTGSWSAVGGSAARVGTGSGWSARAVAAAAHHGQPAAKTSWWWVASVVQVTSADSAVRTARSHSLGEGRSRPPQRWISPTSGPDVAGVSRSGPSRFARRRQSSWRAVSSASVASDSGRHSVNRARSSMRSPVRENTPAWPAVWTAAVISARLRAARRRWRHVVPGAARARSAGSANVARSSSKRGSGSSTSQPTTTPSRSWSRSRGAITRVPGTGWTGCASSAMRRTRRSAGGRARSTAMRPGSSTAVACQRPLATARAAPSVTQRSSLVRCRVLGTAGAGGWRCRSTPTVQHAEATLSTLDNSSLAAPLQPQPTNTTSWPPPARGARRPSPTRSSPARPPTLPHFHRPQTKVP